MFFKRLTWRQQKWLISSLIALIVVFAWPWVQSKLFNIPSAAQPGWYYVHEVSDGDTIGVIMNGAEERVRLIGVDTPETHRPGSPVQCYGQKASDISRDKLLYKTVRLESDPTNDNRDRYDRLLRYVYLDDGTLWNQELIAQGAGFAYVSFPFEKRAEFTRTQGEAVRDDRGLWGECRTTERNGRWQTNDID